MRSRPRREAWRVTHAFLAQQHRTGAVMGRRKVAVVRGGVVKPGSLFTPITWPASDDRVARMLTYTPTHRPENWPQHRDVVIDLVRRLEHGHLDHNRDRHWCGTLHAFFTWAEDHGCSTEPETLLADPRISEFIDAAYANDKTKATHQYRLRSTAALIFPAPQHKRIPRGAAMAPHTAAEQEGFITGREALIRGHKATLKTQQRTYRDVGVIFALTFGAGCTSSVVHSLPQSAVDDGPDGMWLTKPGQDMPVPVAEPWAQMLRASLTGDPDAYLLAPHSTGIRNECVGKVMAKAREKEMTLRGFDADRAAKYWQVQMLSTIGFDVIAAMCGYKPGSQMPGDLVPYLPARTMDAAQRMARGWVA